MYILNFHYKNLWIDSLNKIITTYIERKYIKLVIPILIYTINYHSINIFDSIIPMN